MGRGTVKRAASQINKNKIKYTNKIIKAARDAQSHCAISMAVQYNWSCGDNIN